MAAWRRNVVTPATSRSKISTPSSHQPSTLGLPSAPNRCQVFFHLSKALFQQWVFDLRGFPVNS
jgi:hypothetical protein